MEENFICKLCGEEVEGGAESCPACGACDLTGWKEDEADEYADDFDYDKFVRDELGGRPSWPARDKIIAGIALLLVGIWLLLYVF